MDSAAIGSSSMILDNKRAPCAAGPLRQASRLHTRVTAGRCLADFPEPRFSGAGDFGSGSIEQFRVFDGSSTKGMSTARRTRATQNPLGSGCSQKSLPAGAGPGGGEVTGRAAIAAAN
jgi:hypothetical protein